MVCCGASFSFSFPPFFVAKAQFTPHSSKPTRVRADETANMVPVRRLLRMYQGRGNFVCIFLCSKGGLMYRT